MKKQPLVLLLLSTLLCLSTQAQHPVPAQTRNSPQTAKPPQKPSHWSLNILAGPAFPVGAYDDLDHQVPGAGPIHTGGVAELSGTYHLNRSFGVVLLAGGQINKGNGIHYVHPLTYPPVPTVYDGQIYNRDYWEIARFMTGGEYALPLCKKQGLSLLIRLLGGAQKTKPADYNSGGGIYYPYVSLPWSFSYQADAGLKWQGRGRVALVAYAGYNGCRPSTKLANIVVSDPPSYSLYEVKATFPTGSLLFRAGIEIGL